MSRGAAILVVARLLVASSSPAQSRASDSTLPHQIRWYEATVAAAGVTTLMLVDEPVQAAMQRSRSSRSDGVARVLRRAGQPEVYGTVTLGFIGAGLLGRRPTLTRAGGRLAGSLALAATCSTTLKVLMGRARPIADVGAFVFRPFTDNTSFPSGHTVMAFALATSLADELERSWATVGLYALATGTAWSRLNDDRHWVSDVALGALIGVTSSKLISGRWRAFGIAPPRFLLEPDGRATIRWHQTF